MTKEGAACPHGRGRLGAATVGALLVALSLGGCDGDGDGGATDAGSLPDGSVGDAGVPPLREEQTLVPHASWSCGKPAGIPPPRLGPLILEASVGIAETHEIGETQYGRRTQHSLGAGTVTGSRVRGEILSGGLDYELTLANGAQEVEQVLVLRTDDQELLYFRVCGTAPSAGSELRVVPVVEASATGSYAFLNSGEFAGIRTVDAAGRTIGLRIHDVADVPLGSDVVRVENPEGVRDQSWDCVPASGTRGPLSFSVNVLIAAPMQIGMTQRGLRTYIPITGGSVSGMVTGTVLPGGGDFQLVSDTLRLDARYAMRTAQGEVVIVRNCGPFDALAPTYEARSDGPSAWLNDRSFRSAPPSIGVGSVSLMIYEAN